MDSVDMFCVGDDRHRVALLEDFLVKSGMAVELHTRPLTRPSDPCLVACTARSLRAPWIAALFDADVSVVALRLDDTPLPGPCLRAINLQSWPARTADRKVGDLVGWLMRHGGDETPLAADGGADGGTAGTSGGARRPASARTSDTRRALLVLLLLIGGGALLFNLAPERRPGRAEPVADDAEMLPVGPVISDGVVAVAVEAGSDPAPAGRPPGAAGDPVTNAVAEAVAAAPDAAANAAAGAGSRPAAGGRTPSRVGDAEGVVPSDDGGGPAAAAAGSSADGSRADGPAVADPPVAGTADLDPAAATRADDALAHLCAARSLAAARAWADALDWKQRRRARSEPCVARLLARPGYAPLRARLNIR